MTLLYNMYRNYGWKGLIEEVEMDVKRISHRNLGRDDRQVYSYGLLCMLLMKVSFTRCIGDHGREARFPFLDENVVSYLQSLPMSDKVIVLLLYITIYNVCYYVTIGGLHATTWGRRETYLENCSPSAWL